MCTANSIRSQLAEGLWREIGGEEWEVHSAGVAGAGGVHPLVHRTLAELGIDSSEQFSKPLDHFAGQSFEVVCCVSSEAVGDPLQGIDIGVRLEWISGDPLISLPGTDRMDAFKRLAEALKSRIKDFCKEYASL